VAVLRQPGMRPHQPCLAAVPLYVPAALAAAALLLVAAARLPVRRAGYAVGLLFALAFAAFYAGAMQALGPHYDLRTAAARVAQAQAAGSPVAFVGRYHAQFPFLGRLQQPLAELRTEQLATWAAAHPNGSVAVGCDGPLPPVPGIYQQPYRGGTLRLWPVARLGGFDVRALCGE
jgi:hypothetical protein